MTRMVWLNGAWKMRAADEEKWLDAQVPGSVYGDLLAAGEMEDPFWRANEQAAFDLMEKDYLYCREFEVPSQLLSADALLLVCQGLDTLATISINGREALRANNMHRIWVQDVKPLLHGGVNQIQVRFDSPNRFVREGYQACRVLGSSDATEGFPLLRKAHCMFGWDWGPRLPDAGIWRDIYIQAVDHARLLGVRIHQTHEDGRVSLSFFPEMEVYSGESADFRTEYTVTGPDGEIFTVEDGDICIDRPKLWWPNGLGEQPLYRVEARLLCDGREVDVWQGRIGLRTMTMRRVKDEARNARPGGIMGALEEIAAMSKGEPVTGGESFELTVNDVSVFAMGADYIPEDNLLPRVTPERTRRLLEDAKAAHHNSIRVWGGGYYPSDAFYDACDELGLVVWQDFMFACAMYELTDEFEENITAEFEDNIRRLRCHASLGLWCGNNEMEMFADQGNWVATPKQKGDYIKMYEYIIPKALKKLDPDTFYWPASPSSGGSFDNPNDPNRGDVHYWDVWHGNKPFTEYRKFFFRYVSEFGFQSFPSLKTVESFTLPEDRNIFSYVMEKHQRNNAANGKIMNYLAQTFLYPGDFETMLYASQLLQAEAIRYGVEHWRRNRGYCMGAVVWQLNDCWPVASWASIDYYGRWKALHYAEKRFFAPVLLSCQEEGTLTQRTNVNAEMREDAVEKSIRLNVSNETRSCADVTVKWALRNARAQVLRQGEERLTVDALSARWLEKIVFPQAELYGNYVSYELWQNGERQSAGSVLFCAPKHFHFADPELSLTREGDLLTVPAAAYARSVEIVCDDGDVLFDDNYFDLNAETRKIHILRGEGTKFRLRSVYDIR